MSSVLEFDLRRRANVPAAVATGEAEIIIFPGVRIERIVFDAEIFEPEEPAAPGSGLPFGGPKAVKLS